MKHKLKIRTALLAFVLLSATAVFLASLNRARRPPVKIVGFYQSGVSNRLTVEIRNDAPGKVRLYAIELRSRVGTNWPSVTEVQLGFTNCTESFLRIEVDPPPAVWPRPWKASLVYMPAFSRTTLLGYQLQEAWKSKSLRQAFSHHQEGWGAAHRTFSEELAQ